MAKYEIKKERNLNDEFVFHAYDMNGVYISHTTAETALRCKERLIVALRRKESTVVETVEL